MKVVLSVVEVDCSAYDKNERLPVTSHPSSAYYYSDINEFAIITIILHVNSVNLSPRPHLSHIVHVTQNYNTHNIPYNLFLLNATLCYLLNGTL